MYTSNEEPIYHVKPVFRWKQTLIISMVVSAFLYPFVMGFSSMFIFIIGMILTLVFVNDRTLARLEETMMGETLDVEKWGYLAVALPTLFYAGLYVLMVWFIYRHTKKTVERTEYNFYNDRIQYTEGFWTKNYRSILYKDIIGVSMSQSPAQERLGIGTMTLETASTNTRITVSNVPDVDRLVKMVQDLRAKNN